MAAIDWQFIRPLDQTPNIAALASGNQQMNAGFQTIANSIGGLADTFKQRNTDEILNALYQAQTSQELPGAMSAVNALQQQYGRGFDQAAVRQAIDTRGSTLAQRDLQNINLQQAQAAQAALPQIQAFNAAQMQSAGATPEQIAAFNAIQGIDTSNLANSAMSGLRSDRSYDRGVFESDRAFKRQGERDAVSDAQWEASNNRANITTAASLAKEYVTPASVGWTTDANGTPVPVSKSGTTFGDALPAVMQSLFNTESGGVHRKADGSLTRSPKGALGVAQIMPKTAANPGYGMKPINLQTTSPDEQKAWATDYITRIQKAHGFTNEQAVAAYNAGAGAVQKAIKDGGSNWLSKLPQETRDYVPKVLGGSTGGSKASQATQAVMGNPVTNAAMSKAIAGYQDGFAKLNAAYNQEEASAKVKGSASATGKSVDTWVASKKESSWFGNSDNPIFTKAGDIGKMARQDAAFNNLPDDAQTKVLDAAYGYLRNSGSFERVPNKQLRDIINRESKAYKQTRIDQFNAQKASLAESAYQDVVQAYQAVGARPPTREGVNKMLGIQSNIPAPKPQPVATPGSKLPATIAKPAETPAAKTPTRTSTGVPAMDRQLAERAARKQAERDRVDAKLAKQKAETKKAETKPLTFGANTKQFQLPNGTTQMSNAQLQELFKKYQVR